MILEQIISLLKQLNERQQQFEMRQVRIECKLDSLTLLPCTQNCTPAQDKQKRYAITTAAKMLGVSPATVRRYSGDDQVVDVERLRCDINTVREAMRP